MNGSSSDNVRKQDHLTTRAGLKRYGLLSALVAAAVVFVSAGMPGHFLWRWVGVPLIIIFVLVFAPFLFYGGRYLWEHLEDANRS
jgi:energy-coupling factor transporter transmembrane protein EcfT